MSFLCPSLLASLIYDEKMKARTQFLLLFFSFLFILFFLILFFLFSSLLSLSLLTSLATD